MFSFFLSVSSFWPEQAVMLIRLYCMLIIKSGYTRRGFPLPSVYPHILLQTPLCTVFLLLIVYLRPFISISVYITLALVFCLMVLHSSDRWECFEDYGKECIYSHRPAFQAYCCLCVSHTVDPKHRSEISRSVVIITSGVWITAAEVLWRLQAWLEECCLWIRQEFSANSVFFSSKCLVSRRFLDSFRASGKYRNQAR